MKPGATAGPRRAPPTPGPPPPGEARGNRDCRGSATVLATALLGVLVAVAAGLAVLGAAVVDQRRVEAAADLGALAGAAALQRGEPACAAAATVVERNGGRLSRCRAAGEDVTVRASRPTRRMLGLTWAVASTARAGPAR